MTRTRRAVGPPAEAEPEGAPEPAPELVQEAADNEEVVLADPSSAQISSQIAGLVLRHVISYDTLQKLVFM